MVEDDLSQRLWRDGAQSDWKIEKTFLEIIHSADPATAIVNAMLLEGARDEIERLKEANELKTRIFQAQVAETRKLQDVIGTINLHTADDAFFIRKMGLEERELYADAVDAWSARLCVGEEEPWGKFPRWWRDDYVGPLPR